MKHTSRFMLFASLIAAFGMLCCSEDNDTTEDNDISNCTDGTWKCDGNTLSKCISGKWETIHICDENTLCNIATGTCAPNDTSNCTDGTWKCDGNTLSKCASGKWEFSQTCKENTQCNSKTGTCEANDVSECTDGSWKCDGNTLSKCASGKWEWVQACASYEQCNAETGTCDVTLIPDCAEDEHIWNNTCEKDSIENCLEHGNQCKNVANAKSICDREYGGCWFECNEGFGQYVTGIGECSLGGEKYTCNIPGDECVPAFQSKWKLGSRHHYSGTDGKSDASVTIPIDLPKDTSESITIDWGDGQFDLITSETEISKDHSGSNLYWSATYVDKVNDKTFIYHEYPNFDGNLEYVTVKIVGTSNWSCPDKSLERCGMGKLISIQSYGNITFGESAFLNAKNLESLPEDTPRLSNDISMFFYGAEKFNQDISSWDTSNVTDMSGMFWGATAFNQPLNNWDTSKVTDMSNMFLNAYTFNQPLNNWNTSKVTDMRNMFSVATSFNQPLDNWDTSNVTDISGMFKSATVFNQPLNNWNTSKVTNIRNTFVDANAFNQPLDQWNISNVNLNFYSGDSVFKGSGLQKDNYCKLFAGPYSSIWNLIAHYIYLGVRYNCEDTCQNGNCNNTCNDNECFYNNSCINQDNHCGKQCLNCNTFTPHATAGTCNNYGTCQVTACETGYHVNNNACEADSTISCNDNECFYNNSCINQNDHCGKQCLNCNTFTSHATAGTCNNNGSCQVTACEAGYHIYNNACEADSKTNCGAHGKQCPVSAPECLNGICVECNETSMLPTCQGTAYSLVCQSNHKYKLIPCDYNESCVEGKGCVNTCGENFKNYCDDQGRRVYCNDKSEIVISTCSYNEQCNNGVCENIYGTPCLPATYKGKCIAENGQTIAQICDEDTKTVVFHNCSSSIRFCGDINGKTNCYNKCTENDIHHDYTWCEVVNAKNYVGKCEPGKDHKGNSLYGVFLRHAFCNNNSVSCRTATNGHVVFDYLNCSLMGGQNQTCTSNTCAFASCNAPSAVCNNNVAQNCIWDPSHNDGDGGYVMTSMNCATVKGTCTVLNPDGVKRALCNATFTDSNSKTWSSLGTCDGNALYHLYWGENADKPILSSPVICNSTCISKTVNGVSYAYCE